MAINPTPSISLVQSDSSNARVSVNEILNPFEAGSLGTASQAADAAASRIQQNSNYYTFQHAGYLPKYYFVINVASFGGYYAGGGLGGIGNVVGTPLGSMLLPIPKGLEDIHDVQYHEYEIGTPLGSAAAPATGQGSAMGAAGGFAMGAAGLLPGFNALAQAGQAIGGVAMNQFTTIVLKGPKFKRYTLQFDLAPRNAEESANIRDMIRQLHKSASPYLMGENLFWGFPDIVECTFMPQGNGADTYMYRFKPAVMESVRANYAPNMAVGFYPTGAPEAVSLTISFLELEYWLQSDY